MSATLANNNSTSPSLSRTTTGHTIPSMRFPTTSAVSNSGGVSSGNMFQYDDPLDAEDFDPITYINQRFPTEASLDDLDTFTLSVDSKISAIEESLSKAVQSQSKVGQQASKDIAIAQVSIQDLFTKLNEIKFQASHSERMVQEICADIRKLDCAKNHLQGSITALKRLQMLTTAIDQLEILLKDMMYKDMAHLLEAARQLMAFFDKYNSIPQIMTLKSRLDTICSTLRRHVHHTFLDIGQLVESVADTDVMLKELPGNMRTLADASLLVDALGPEMRINVLDEFIIAQLNPYKRLFGPNMAYHTVEHVDRRWAWFKRLLKSIEFKFSNIWPAHWEVSKKICIAFMELTRDHTTSFLIQMDSDEHQDVSQLLKALQTTLRFEQEMEARFGFETRSKQKNTNNSNANTYEQQRVDSNPFAEDDDDENNDDGEQGAKQSLVASDTIVVKLSISDEYDKHLGSYVLLERQNLDEMLENLKIEEDTIRETGTEEEYSVAASNNNNNSNSGSAIIVSGVSSKANVYDSSIQMFVFIKNSIKRCTTLTTGQTFLALSHEFRHSLRKYAESLKKKSVTATKGLNGEITTCYLINTAEYCADVVPRLESMVKSKIKEEYADKVDFNPEVDLFMDLVADFIKLLSNVVMERIEPSFKVLTTTNWAALTQVGEESAYLLQIQAVLMDMIPRIQPIVSDVYYKNFCSKVANDTMHKYLDIIMKQRALSELATQQLLLDTYMLKTIVLNLHKMGSDGPVHIPTSYTKVVSSRMLQIENVLKLLGTPMGSLIERYVALLPDGSIADLQAIMTVKGIKKSEQQSAIDAFQSSNPDVLKSPTISGTSATTNTSTGGGNDSFPMVVSLSALASSDNKYAISMGMASMRNLTTDLTFSVGNLKWNK